MMKHMKKLIAILAVLSLMAGIFCGLTVSGAVADWYASVGSPSMKAAADPDFCSFRVNAAAAMTTKKTVNVLDQEVFLQDLSVADGGYWGMIGFKAQAQGLNSCESDAALGSLALLIENKATYYRLFFFRSNKIYEIGKLPMDDTYCIRFQKADDGVYQMQINGNTYRHDFIDTYGKKGFLRKSYVTMFASNWMNGDVTVRDRFWESENAAGTTAVYPFADATVISTESDEDYFYTNDTVDFSTDKIEFSELTVPAKAEFTLCFNKNEPFYEENTATNGSVLNFSFADNGKAIEVTLAGSKPKALGTVAKADTYSCRFIQSGDSYALKVNDTVLDANAAIKSFMKSPEAFLILGTNSAFSAKVYLCRYSWYQFAGPDGAKVEINDDDSCYVSVTAAQNVVAPRQYDLFTTGMELSGLEIPAVNTSSHGALIYLGKTLEKCAPCAAAQDAMSLLIEQTADGVSFNLLNSNGGTKTLLGTVEQAESYRVSFIRKFKRWVLLVNDTAMDINTKTDEQSVRAINDIKTFLGEGDKCMTYFALAANNYAKATVSLFSFVPPEDPEGFSLLTGSGVSAAPGNETDGYTVRETAAVTALTNNIYNQVDYSLAATLKSAPAKLTFWVSKTDISDKNFTPGKNPDRFAFFLTPAENNTKATVSCIGSDGTTEITLGTVNYNWTGKRVLDVRKATDGNWYFAVNSMPVQGTVLPVLNDFMNSNTSGELFYGLGSDSGMELSLLKIVASPTTPVPIDDPGWEQYSSDRGDLPQAEDGTYYLSRPAIQTFAFSKGTYDITKTSLSLKINSVKEWLYFDLSTTGISDNNPLPTGENPKRAAFVITPQANNTKAQISIWASNFKSGLTALDTIDFDWTGVHTFDVRAGSDGHWYLWVDNKMKSAAISPMLDDFIERNGTTALRYGTGGFAGFDAEQIRVVDQTPGDNYIDVGGWRTYSGVSVTVEGDSRDGYHLSANGGMFAYSKLTYDIKKTALSLQVNDVAGWLYFSISATNNSDNYLPVGPGDQVSRVVFVITPSGMNAQFGHWAPDGKSATLSIITSYEFDWFGSPHTFDVRQSNDPEDDNWYLCVDGRLLMNRVSEVLNQFMKKHDGEELYYGTGGFNGFDGSEIKIVNKPALKTAEESSEAGGGTVEYTGDYDFDIEFDNFEEQENQPTVDFDFGGEVVDYDNTPVELEEEPELTEVEDPRDYLQVVKAKKRRLVQKGHGIIFDPWEIILMIVGAVVLLGGATFFIIFFIKRSRKKKQN